MKVGQLVVPAGDSDPLRSGGSAYGYAVVASVEPFILVATSCDMVWYTKKPENLRSVGWADPDMINGTQWNIPPEHQIRVSEGESFFNSRLSCGLTLMGLGSKPMAVDLNKKVLAKRCFYDGTAEITGYDNKTYGWVFEYDDEQKWWKAKERLSDEALARYEQQANDQRVDLLYRADQEGSLGVSHFRAFDYRTLRSADPVIAQA